MPEKGHRPAYWVRAELELSEGVDASLHVTALGIYEVFLDGRPGGRRRAGAGVHAVRQTRAVPVLRRVWAHPGPPRGRGAAGRRLVPRADRRAPGRRPVRQPYGSAPAAGDAGRVSRAAAGDRQRMAGCWLARARGGPDRRAARGPQALVRPGCMRLGTTCRDGRRWRSSTSGSRWSASRPSRAPHRGAPAGLGGATTRRTWLVDLGQNINGWVAVVRSGARRNHVDPAPWRAPGRGRRPDDESPRREPSVPPRAAAARTGGRGHVRRARG